MAVHDSHVIDRGGANWHCDRCGLLIDDVRIENPCVPLHSVDRTHSEPCAACQERGFRVFIREHDARKFPEFKTCAPCKGAGRIYYDKRGEKVE